MTGLSVEILVALGFATLGLLAVGLVAVGLPGAWLLIAAAITTDLLQDMWMPASAPLTFHPITIGVAVLVAAIGEVLEFALSAAGAKRFGASRAGMLGSIIGGVLGALVGTCAIPLPVAGTLAAGRPADILVVPGDPLADLTALGRPRDVWQAGARVPQEV